MAKLTRLRKSVSKQDSEEYNKWSMDLRQSRRTPKIIHKKQTTSKSGEKKERKPRAPKKITTRSGNKAIAATLTKEEKDKLIKELTGK